MFLSTYSCELCNWPLGCYVWTLINKNWHIILVYLHGIVLNQLSRDNFIIIIIIIIICRVVTRTDSEGRTSTATKYWTSEKCSFVTFPLSLLGCKLKCIVAAGLIWDECSQIIKQADIAPSEASEWVSGRIPEVLRARSCNLSMRRCIARCTFTDPSILILSPWCDDN
jgi:hypothetical protein